jgi:hypothetical protein
MYSSSGNCGNWDCFRSVPFLGILVSNFRYWFFAVHRCNVVYAILWRCRLLTRLQYMHWLAVISLTWLHCSVCSIVAAAVCLHGCCVWSEVAAGFVPYTVHGYMAVLSSERRPGVTRITTRPAMLNFSADSQLSTVTLLFTVYQQREFVIDRSAQLSSSCQGKQYGPLFPVSITVQIQLSWEVCRSAPAL